eukprot:201462-Pelagomonas_calceolata.AAC.2
MVASNNVWEWLDVDWQDGVAMHVYVCVCVKMGGVMAGVDVDVGVGVWLSGWLHGRNSAYAHTHTLMWCACDAAGVVEQRNHLYHTPLDMLRKIQLSGQAPPNADAMVGWKVQAHARQKSTEISRKIRPGLGLSHVDTMAVKGMLRGGHKMQYVVGRNA